CFIDLICVRRPSSLPSLQRKAVPPIRSCAGTIRPHISAGCPDRGPLFRLPLAGGVKRKGRVMKQEKYTERMQGFLQSAQMLALREGNQRFVPDHVLKVLLDDPEGLAANLIQSAGGDSRAVHRAVEANLAKLPKVEGSGAGQVMMAPETARLFDNAESIAEKAGDSFVTVERMLLALVLAKGTDAAKALAEGGVKAQALEKAIAELRKGRTADTASAESTYDALKK